MSHSLRRRRASSLAASSLSFCCRIRLSTISVYLLSALALHTSRHVVAGTVSNPSGWSVSVHHWSRTADNNMEEEDISSTMTDDCTHVLDQQGTTSMSLNQIREQDHRCWKVSETRSCGVQHAGV